MKDYSAMDEALDFLSAYGPDLVNGFTNHAPMVADALCALGRADAVMPLLRQQTPAFLPRPQPRGMIDPEEWCAALGNNGAGEWSTFFETALCSRRWQDVLAEWAVRLAPGISAAAAHGAIRTSHAARSLGEEETPSRRRELADGLGYWAAHYSTLPAADATTRPSRAQEAIGAVPLVPLANRRAHSSISAALADLEMFPDFAPAIGLLDVNGDPARILSDVTETFARVYLANAGVHATIAFIHGITGPVALRSLLPLLPADAARAALRYAWQTGAALYATYGATAPSMEAIAAPPGGRTALIDAAIASGDYHAIKLTEAALREYELNPSPAYLAAAHHAISALS